MAEILHVVLCKTLRRCMGGVAEHAFTVCTQRKYLVHHMDISIFCAKDNVTVPCLQILKSAYMMNNL